MEISHLSDMKGGWFVGAFTPHVAYTDQFEVAAKHYKAGDKEQCHVHKIATEITLILNGSARMGKHTLHHGDIIKLDPGEETNFFALTDVDTVVVKFPSVKGDKYVL